MDSNGRLNRHVALLVFANKVGELKRMQQKAKGSKKKNRKTSKSDDSEDEENKDEENVQETKDEEGESNLDKTVAYGNNDSAVVDLQFVQQLLHIDILKVGVSVYDAFRGLLLIRSCQFPAGQVPVGDQGAGV